jgi:hypothetical protein
MKASSFLAEEEIIFEQDEISIITELTLAGRIFAVTMILISIPLYLLIYLFFASVPFFVDVPYNYVFLAAFLFFIVYSVDYCVKNRHHFRTYAVIAYLFTFQPFLTVLCSQNALIAVQCVSPDFFMQK